MRFDIAFADRVTAAVFFVLGAAMLYGGYTMDRLEVRQIHPASFPGLVPIVLGGALMLCALLLFIGALKKSGKDEFEANPVLNGESWKSFFAAAAWSIVYALGLVGKMPFFVATFIYIAVFIAYFSWPKESDKTKRIRTIIFAVLFALAISVAISSLFRYGFLVRLP